MPSTLYNRYFYTRTTRSSSIFPRPPIARRTIHTQPHFVFVTGVSYQIPLTGTNHIFSSRLRKISPNTETPWLRDRRSDIRGVFSISLNSSACNSRCTYFLLKTPTSQCQLLRSHRLYYYYTLHTGMSRSKDPSILRDTRTSFLRRRWLDSNCRHI